MSIVQEALKKAQGNYLENKPTRLIQPSLRKITRPAAPVRNRPLKARQKRRSVFWLTFILFVIVLPAFGIRTFSILTHKEITEDKKTVPHITPVPSLLKSAVEPVNAAPVPSPAPARPEFVLNGTMRLDNKLEAIINGYILEEGDTINGATVILIEKDYVLLNLKEEKIKVKLRE